MVAMPDAFQMQQQKQHDTAVSGFLQRAGYRNPGLARRDVLAVLGQYRGLEPKLKQYVFNDGRSRDLLTLEGTIPVPYRGTTYNIPVAFWLLDTHPDHAPMCYVRPTSQMQIRASEYVDLTGRIYLPYLHEWAQSTSDLLGLVQVCIIVFGDRPPVFSRRPAGPGQPENPPGMAMMATPPPYPPMHPAAGTTTTPPYGAGPPPGGSYGSFPAYGSSGAGPNNGGAFTSGCGTGTITQEHIRASLQSAVEDKVRKALAEAFHTKRAEIDSLKKIRDELGSGKDNLAATLAQLQREQSDLDRVHVSLSSVKKDLDEALEKAEERTRRAAAEEEERASREGEEGSSGTESAAADPETVAVEAATPLFRQLVRAFAEESAHADCIYYLGEALRRGIMDCDTFLKHVRNLSRAQFYLRATMDKCREKAGLPT